jgi:hypothetical protein
MEKFGSDNVRVLLYESFKADPDGYAHDLGSFLGVDARTLRTLMSGKHELRSKGRPSPWEGGHATAIAGEAPHPGLFGRLGWMFGLRVADTARLPMDEEIAALREIYREGNAQLARRLSLPLDRFGYAV